MNYWLLKSEPSVFSIDHLQHAQSVIWDGVRNYQARNHLRTTHIGDLAFFYHSSTQLTGIVGTCTMTEVECGRSLAIRPAVALLRSQEHP